MPEVKDIYNFMKGLYECGQFRYSKFLFLILILLQPRVLYNKLGLHQQADRLHCNAFLANKLEANPPLLFVNCTEGVGRQILVK